jgi:integrase
MTVLRGMHEVRQNAFIFPGEREGKPLSPNAIAQVVWRTMGRGDITVHGFRSTFRDWTGEATSFDNQLAEAALHHKLRSGTEAAYARGDLFDKRRKLMEAWAKFCTQPRPRRVTRWWCHCGQGREHD